MLKVWFREWKIFENVLNPIALFQESAMEVIDLPQVCSIIAHFLSIFQINQSG